jgi:hypothetical protein
MEFLAMDGLPGAKAGLAFAVNHCAVPRAILPWIAMRSTIRAAKKLLQTAARRNQQVAEQQSGHQ